MENISVTIDPDISGCCYYFSDGNVQYVRGTFEKNAKLIKCFTEVYKLKNIYVNDFGFGASLMHFMKIEGIKFEVCSKKKYL